jgi:predicted urease superfamily metal-dependent hydrolase
VERERVVEEIRRAMDERARGERIGELAGLNRALVLVGWMPEDVRAVVAAN